MKPTLENLKEWLEKYTKSKIYNDVEFSQLDIDAIEKCFKSYLGYFDINKVSSGNELKKIFMNFTFSISHGATFDLKRAYEIEADVCNFRSELTQQTITNSRSFCCPIDKRLKSYKFELWHDSWNNQIMIDRDDSTHFIRIEWSSLFNAIYDFFNTSSPKKTYIQQSLF